MESALHRFVRLLRLYGVRISVAETLDALAAAGQPGVLADREVLRAALVVSLIKDRRDLDVFDVVFDKFFGLRPVVDDQTHEHSHAHDDLDDEGELTSFTLSDRDGDDAGEGHSHGKPKDIRQFFDPEDMAQQYNLHQEANRLDMAGMTDEVVLSDKQGTDPGEVARVQISTSRLHNPGAPGKLSSAPSLRLDTELSIAEQMALLSWLEDPDSFNDDDGTGDEALASLRQELLPLLTSLPELLRQRLEAHLAANREMETREVEADQLHLINENDRYELEQYLRRLLRGLDGSPRPRRKVAARGVVDGARTMRNNMRYDGIPFRPVTVAKAEDRPRLVILCDLSLSVRNVSAFTLQVVHGLQALANRSRTFAFVADTVEITDVFSEHRIEKALSLIMAGVQGGGMLDVDADSDYGHAFEQFMEEYGSSVTSRTSVLVLGDGRSTSGRTGITAFEELTRRARTTIWLTPEPRYSWALGQCHLPLYAEFCDRVEVVRSLAGLDRVSRSAVRLGT